MPTGPSSARNASQKAAASMRPGGPAVPDQQREGDGVERRDQDRPGDLVPGDPLEPEREHDRHERELRVDPRLGDAGHAAPPTRPATTARRRGTRRPSAGWVRRTRGPRSDVPARTRPRAPPPRHAFHPMRARFRVRCRASGFSPRSRASATARGSASATSSAVIGPPRPSGRGEPRRAPVQPRAGRRERREVGIRRPPRRRRRAPR